MLFIKWKQQKRGWPRWWCCPCCTENQQMLWKWQN